MFQPAIIDDTDVELQEGFVAYLEIDDSVDPRDLERIQFLNDVILVTIQDDGELCVCLIDVSYYVLLVVLIQNQLSLNCQLWVSSFRNT